MSVAIIRRRNLGRTSCAEIRKMMKHPARIVKTWRTPTTRWPYRGKMRPEEDMVIRWGCTSELPNPNHQFTKDNVLNTVKSIGEVNDKAGFRKTLMRAANYPDWLCPPTYFNYDHISNDDADSGVVIRPNSHSRGRNLWVEYGWTAIKNRCQHMGADNYYFSSLISKDKEYRVFVVSGRVVCVAEKTPGNPDDVAWNVAKGGRFDVLNWDQWPLQAVRKSVEAFNLSSLDFGGVDVMVDKEGTAYVIEINSAPSLTSPYRQSCMAKAFDYIIENGKDRIPLQTERGGWKKFIHPCITEEAR